MPQTTTARGGQTKANGPAIRVIRQRSEMSVSDVVEAVTAEGLNLHPDHLRNIELGRKDPSDKLLGAIARALKCPKAAILRAHIEDAA